MLIPLNALTFLSKLYENQFLKFINDYFTYHKLLEDTSCNLDSLYCNPEQYKSVIKALCELSEALTNHINNIPNIPY